MAHDLSNHRKSYEKQELLESNCPENPIELFQQWFLNADASEMVDEANAVTVSSIGLDGLIISLSKMVANEPRDKENSTWFLSER